MYLIRQYGTQLVQCKHKWPTRVMSSAPIFLNTSSVLKLIHHKVKEIKPMVYYWATLAQRPIPYQKPQKGPKDQRPQFYATTTASPVGCGSKECVPSVPCLSFHLLLGSPLCNKSKLRC